MATVSKKARSQSRGNKAAPAKPQVKAPSTAPAKATRVVRTVAKVTSKAKSAAPAAAASVAEPERSSAPLAEVDAAVLEFIAAIDTFKKQHGRPFPSWSEVLLIVRQLGYRRD